MGDFHIITLKKREDRKNRMTDKKDLIPKCVCNSEFSKSDRTLEFRFQRRLITISEIIRIGLIPNDLKNPTGVCLCLHTHKEHKQTPEGVYSGACKKCECKAFIIRGFISDEGTNFEVFSNETNDSGVLDTEQPPEP